MMLDIGAAKSILDDVLDELPEAQWQAAYGFPCMFAGGKVFGLFDGDFIVLRFRPEQIEMLVGQGEGVALTRAKVTTRKTWLRVDHEQLPGPERLRELILLSYETRLVDIAGSGDA